MFKQCFISDDKDDIANIIKNVLYMYSIREYHYRKRITHYVKPPIYYIYKCLCEYIDTEKYFLICDIQSTYICYKKGNITLNKNEKDEYLLSIASPIEINFKFSLIEYEKAIREKHLNELIMQQLIHCV